MIRKYKDKRNKAFIGAIIGAVGNIASGITQRNAAKKQAQFEKEMYAKEAYAEKNNLQNQLNIINDTNAKLQKIADDTYKRQLDQSLTNAISSIDDENYNNKFTYKCGGSKNISHRNTRKKANFGSMLKEDAGNIASATGALIGNAISASVNKFTRQAERAKFEYSHQNDDLKNKIFEAQNYIVNEHAAPSITTNKQLNQDNNDTINNPFVTNYTYNDRLNMAKLGKRILLRYK